MSRRIVIGSRGSDLALVQARFIAGELARLEPGVELHIEIITSRGDTVQDVPLAKVGGKGIFTKELEVALLDRSIDLAVHSLKDLPMDLPEGLVVGAIPAREAHEDVIITPHGSLDALPQGARVGTSSLRRKVQLLALRPDLEVVDIRGNVPTRLRKLEEGEYDGIVLAAAGLRRLGLEGKVTEVLSSPRMLPAPGQGALAVELRADDTELLVLVRRLNDAETEAAVSAERALLQATGGGCHAPLGAWARLDGAELVLTACYAAVPDEPLRRVELRGPQGDAVQLGQAAARVLLQEQGALERPLEGKRIVVTRAQAQAGKLAGMLEDLGAEVLALPLISIQPRQSLPERLTGQTYDWIIFTSANAVDCFVDLWDRAVHERAVLLHTSICALGPATAEAVLHHGLPVTLTPADYIAEGVLKVMETVDGGLADKRILLPQGDKARPMLARALRSRKAQVMTVVVYDTHPAPVTEEGAATLRAFAPDAITFTSPSTVDSFFATVNHQALVDSTALVSIGPETSKALHRHNAPTAIEAKRHDVPGLVEAIKELFSAERNSVCSL